MTREKVSLKVNLTIIGCSALAFCGVLLETAMNVTFPTLMRQFNLPLATVEWVATGYLLAVAITMALGAYAQRQFSFQKIIMTATILFLSGGLLCAFAGGFWLLLVGRIIQGIATGLIMPLLFAEIMREIPHRIQGSYVGIAGMVVALAPSVGPSYGGIVTQSFGWQMIFVLVLPIGVLAGGLASVTVKKMSRTAIKQRFSVLQGICLSFALIGFIIGFNQMGSAGLSTSVVWGSLLIGIGGLIAFGLLSHRSAYPIINLKIFRSAGFRLALGLYFLLMFMQVGQTFLVPNFAQIVLKTGTFEAGALLLAGSLASAVLAPIAGRLFDRFPVKRTLTIGCVFIVLAASGLLGMANHLSVIDIVAGFLVFMVGFSFIFNNAMTYGLQQLSADLVADGNATFNTLQQYAASLSTAVVGTIVTLVGGPQTSVSDMKQSAIEVYLMLFVLALVVVGLVVRLCYFDKGNH